MRSSIRRSTVPDRYNVEIMAVVVAVRYFSHRVVRRFDSCEFGPANNVTKP
jgi:hypothetical protein